MFSQKTHRKIFIFFLMLLAVGLTFGKIVLSISMIGLTINWLFEGGFSEKQQRIKNRKYASFLRFPFVLLFCVPAFSQMSCDSLFSVSFFVFLFQIPFSIFLISDVAFRVSFFVCRFVRFSLFVFRVCFVFLFSVFVFRVSFSFSLIF